MVACFNDAQLNELEQQAISGNQSLKAAAANIQASAHYVQQRKLNVCQVLVLAFGPTRQNLLPLHWV